MIDETVVREIALGLPGATEEPGSMHFRVNDRDFVWPYLERVDPKKARVERRDRVLVRVDSEDEKFALIASKPAIYFTTDHYNGYAMVIVRLAEISRDELEEMISGSHALAAAPKRRPRKRSG